MKIKSIYKALSYCSNLLNYPDSTAVHKIDSLKKLISDLNLSQPGISFQKQKPSFKAEKLTDLETEYISPFVTSVNGVNCVSYASLWIENKIMGEETLKIQQFYGNCGFKLNPEIIKGSPDHIVLKIGFLSRP